MENNTNEVKVSSPKKSSLLKQIIAFILISAFVIMLGMGVGRSGFLPDDPFGIVGGVMLMIFIPISFFVIRFIYGLILRESISEIFRMSVLQTFLFVIVSIFILLPLSEKIESWKWQKDRGISVRTSSVADSAFKESNPNLCLEKLSDKKSQQYCLLFLSNGNYYECSAQIKSNSPICVKIRELLSKYDPNER